MALLSSTAGDGELTARAREYCYALSAKADRHDGDETGDSTLLFGVDYSW